MDGYALFADRRAQPTMREAVSVDFYPSSPGSMPARPVVLGFELLEKVSVPWTELNTVRYDLGPIPPCRRPCPCFCQVSRISPCPVSTLVVRGWAISRPQTARDERRDVNSDQRVAVSRRRQEDSGQDEKSARYVKSILSVPGSGAEQRATEILSDQSHHMQPGTCRQKVTWPLKCRAGVKTRGWSDLGPAWAAVKVAFGRETECHDGLGDILRLNFETQRVAAALEHWSKGELIPWPFWTPNERLTPCFAGPRALNAAGLLSKPPMPRLMRSTESFLLLRVRDKVVGLVPA